MSKCKPLFVGRLDDMAAGLVAGVGLTMMWAGWSYGTGRDILIMLATS